MWQTSNGWRTVPATERIDSLQCYAGIYLLLRVFATMRGLR